jgi:S-adenosyl methyltransferase
VRGRTDISWPGWCGSWPPTAGSGNFSYIGTGLPVHDSTHEIAQKAAPDSKIVYVDNDPLVLVHARALLGSTTAEGTCGYVDADLHEPEHIVAQAAQTLDFTQPVAILLLAIVHFIADTDDPAGIVATLASALAPRLLSGDLASDRRFRARAGRRRHGRVQHPSAGAGDRPVPLPSDRPVWRAAAAGAGGGAGDRMAPGRR